MQARISNVDDSWVRAITLILLQQDSFPLYCLAQSWR